MGDASPKGFKLRDRWWRANQGVVTHAMPRTAVEGNSGGWSTQASPVQGQGIMASIV